MITKTTETKKKRDVLTRTTIMSFYHLLLQPYRTYTTFQTGYPKTLKPIWHLAAEFSPVIQTVKGPVKGLVLTTIRESKKYHSYRGIPYAKAPIGRLRFRAPIEVDPWTEVFDATEDGPICPQIYNNTFVGQEDCLHINVYTPQLPKDGEDTELKAVMYWIYGGSFIRGAASKYYYSPDYLIEEDIVVVTVNYRLGGLGFLALQHQNATGNAGLKDQNLGLRWVHENIAKFGGDPNKVTIVGQSAGSVSVGFHVLSEKSKGLFRSSISMSGVPLCFWGFDTPEDAGRRAYEVAKELGSTATNVHELLEFYYQVDVENLTKTVTELMQVDPPLKPTLENPNYGPDWFITECSLKKYNSGNYNHVPQILGYTKEEMITFLGTKEDILESVKLSWKYAFELRVRKIDMPDMEKYGITNTTLRQIIKTSTDVLFISPTDYTQRLMAKFDDPIYYYRYDFVYDKPLHKIVLGVDLNGAGHGDDIEMIFYSDLFQTNPKANNRVTLLQKRITRLWTNFIKYGNPTPDGTNDTLLNIVWPDSRKSGKMLWLNDDLEVHDRLQSYGITMIESGLQLFGGPSNGYCNINWNNLSLLSVFLVFNWSLATEFSPVIQTTKGPVKGLVLTTIKESKRYHSYRGIPYGKPPIGRLRFKAPIAVDPWTKVFDATKDGPVCPQIYNDTFVGQEDCLNLNVYTPQWNNLSLLSVFLVFNWSLATEFSPVIQTTKGPVKGLVLTTIRESKKYHSYRGIPYGKPPVGHLRFRAPIEVDPWTEVFDATEDGPVCPQIYNDTFVGQEDCLNLNVYTPQLPKQGEETELKAVLFWIYGGSFLSGAASKIYYSPDYLIEEDIVVVTVNYRLGALGFLALQHRNAPGNAGLKDQNLGLRWVRDNIAKFGGDPNKVTIGGEGAGGVSVGYHMLSEKSKDLFRNSISMNGVPLCTWSFEKPEYILRNAYNFAEELGSRASNVNQLLEFYYQVDVKNLTRTITKSTKLSPFLPTRENPDFGPDWFIIEHLLRKYEGDYNHGPYMIGYNNDETLRYAAKLKDFHNAVNESFGYAVALQTKNKLDLDKELANVSPDQFVKEMFFTTSIDFTQQIMANFSESMYYYRYDFSYKNSVHKIVDHLDIDGAAQDDEIKMIFYSDLFQVDPKANNRITLLQRRMTRLWANFVKYGNPTPDGTKDTLLNIVWPESTHSGKMLWLNDDLSVHDRYRTYEEGVTDG
ncbi:juvenile hormone esterase-like isoform X4 [Vespula squamosa]|uniref:Juvenile hormone esterase-like isoform X4 n=1 Tax=Vespula squamosa TaxID=30214 RepID=A0ABD2C6C6_VESSQ